MGCYAIINDYRVHTNSENTHNLMLSEILKDTYILYFLSALEWKISLPPDIAFEQLYPSFKILFFSTI